MHNEPTLRDGGSPRRDNRTETGELERLEMNRRKIDCGVEPNDRRRLPRGGDRRNTGVARPPSPES